MKAASRKSLLTLQSRIAYCIERAADATGNERYLMTLIDTIETQEKEHRAFGRRLVGSHAAKGRASIRAAVNHFLCKVIHEGIEKYKCGAAPIEVLRGIRTDYVLGAILTSHRLFVDALTGYVREAYPDAPPSDTLARAAAVDYCGAIVPEVST